MVGINQYDVSLHADKDKNTRLLRNSVKMTLNARSDHMKRDACWTSYRLILSLVYEEIAGS